MKRCRTTQERVGPLDAEESGIRKTTQREGWIFEPTVDHDEREDAQSQALKRLPIKRPMEVVAKSETPFDLVPRPNPGAPLDAHRKPLRLESDPPGLHDGFAVSVSEEILNDPRVLRDMEVVRKALEEVPDGRKKSEWVEMVAFEYGLTVSSVYRKIQKFNKEGLAGLSRSRRSKGAARAWDEEALEYWKGLVLKRENRKFTLTRRYQCLKEEASRRGWKIGDIRSAQVWAGKICPQLIAYRDGGRRALDNALPPIRRDYSDLAPFEILVGDQHRFDFWVTHDETGELFRPEGYFWQDLRTRVLYGGAVDRRYDGQLMGLALRMGLRVFGAFKTIYTDHGKPEESNYIAGVLEQMKALGLGVEQTVDLETNGQTAGSEATICLADVPGPHRKAIVRNAKAKMIEGTFRYLEQIMRDRLGVPGYVKRLSDPQEHQEVDQKELQTLLKSGKLLCFSEFALRLIQAMNFYNRERPHSGVLREWAWRPKPKIATPWDCLRQCHAAGWNPQSVPPEAVELLFLARDPRGRVVDRGRVRFRRRLYEHRRLIELSGKRVDIRYDPMDLEKLLVYHRGDFVCEAAPLQYSSMKDQDVIRTKITEKARLREDYALQYRTLTTSVPDIRMFSQVPKAEKEAKKIAYIRETEARETENLYREPTLQEVEAHKQRQREFEANPFRPAPRDEVVKRPAAFLSELERVEWIIRAEAEGIGVLEEDRMFKEKYLASQDEDTRNYWETRQKKRIEE